MNDAAHNTNAASNTISRFFKHRPAARRTSACLSLVLLATLLSACNRAPQQAEPRPTPVSPLEQGIRQARSQLAKNIFTISRQDNGELTADDLAYIRRNLPLERVYSGLTEDRRHIIVSMHIEFPPENLNALRQRFAVAQVQT